MKRFFRRAGPFAAIGAIVLVLAASILLLAMPAGMAQSSTNPCGASASASSTASLDGPDDLLPSSGLDATRECGGNPARDQSVDEAIAAGAGLLLFGGAMLLYRQRHPQQPPVARA
ncbi:MAG: hypothetical protein ACYDAC_10680 [Candidatus Dormibacteria bacterium]